MSRSFVPPVWCSCGPDGEHLQGYGETCVRAAVRPRGAVADAIASRPLGPSRASAHRTERTEQRSFGIATPLGRTTLFRQPY